MTVYVEYVFINNLIIDYLLLKAALDLSGVKVKKLRVVLCALLGTGFALIFPLIDLPAPILSAVKVCMGLFLVLVSAKYLSRREILKTAGIFFLLTFSVGGIVTAIYGLFSVELATELPVATVFIPVFIAAKLLISAVKRVVRTKKDEKLVFRVDMKSGAKTVTAKGFLDTGNALFIEGSPAVVIDRRIFGKLLTVDPDNFTLQRVAVTTVAGESDNLGITIEETAKHILRMQ